ncbi:MAG TPA: hypothetical protein VFY14_02680 [Streptomyces sp.]|nr:hypothetical protein [Streptomyces sp.]
MTAPYVFPDRDGNYLTVTRSDGNGVDLTATEAGTRRRATVTVPACRLGDLVAAMYRQAGRTVPMMINPDEVAEDWVRHPGKGVA